jgi:urease alpha subunit
MIIAAHVVNPDSPIEMSMAESRARVETVADVNLDPHRLGTAFVY